MPGTTAKGRCSTAPAAALATVGVTWAARWRGSTTPVAPAHSALRSSAPRLWGSVTPSRTSRNGAGPARRPGGQVVEVDLGQRARPRRAPPGAPRSCASRPAGSGPPGGPGPGRRGQRRDLVEDRGVVDPVGQPHLPDRPAPGGQQLPHGPAALDLVPAHLGRGPSPAAPPGMRAAAVVAAGRRPAPVPTGHRRISRRATAQQAMPSARPRAPSPSARLGLTLTGPPTTAASRCCMASRCGARRGASSTTVQSTLPTRQPVADPADHAGQQVHAVGAQPGRVVVGEVAAEVAEAGRAEQGVGDGVGDTSASLWPPGPGRPGPRRRAPGGGRVVGERVDVEAQPDPPAHGQHPGGPRPAAPRPGRGRAGSVILRLRRLTRHRDHPAAGRLDQRGVVGGVAAAGVGGAQGRGPERLRGLHRDQLAAVDGLDHRRRRPPA